MLWELGQGLISRRWNNWMCLQLLRSQMHIYIGIRQHLCFDQLNQSVLVEGLKLTFVGRGSFFRNIIWHGFWVEMLLSPFCRTTPSCLCCPLAHPISFWFTLSPSSPPLSYDFLHLHVSLNASVSLFAFPPSLHSSPVLANITLLTRYFVGQ